MTKPTIGRVILATVVSAGIWLAGLPAQAAPVDPVEVVTQAASASPDYLEIASWIKQLHRYRNKDLNHETAGQLIHAIVEGMKTGNGDLTEDEQPRLKRLLLKPGKSRVFRYVAVAEPADARLLGLLFYSRSSVMNNLTDAKLRRAVARKGQNLIRKADKQWDAIAPEWLQAIEGYPLADAAAVADLVCQLWWVAGPLPEGAPGTTYASRSLRDVRVAINRMEFAKHSVAVKLLAEQGLLEIPNSVQAAFDWSGGKPVTIDLAFPRWTAADLPELRRLLGHPDYAAAAQAQLARMAP